MNAEKRILMVVEDPGMWEFMTFYLAMQGCKVQRTEQPEQIFRQDSDNRPDIIVIDNSAGSIDLPAFYERAIKEPFPGAIRLLVITSHSDYLSLENILRAQDIFITRPLRPKMLMIIIRSLVYNERPGWIRLVKNRISPRLPGCANFV